MPLNPSATVMQLGDSSAQIFWDKMLLRYLPKRRPLLNESLGICGPKNTCAIQVKDDLTKTRSDEIRLTMVYKLSGRGRGPQEKLADHYEGQGHATYAVKIEKLRHGVQIEDEMSDQRSFWDQAGETVMALGDWMADRMELTFMAQGCGITSINDSVYTGNNTIRALHANHLIWPTGVTNGQSLTTAHPFNNALVRKAATRISLMKNRMRPVRTKLGDLYLWIVSPGMKASAHSEDSAFYGAMQAELVKATSNARGNPLINGEMFGIWEGFLFLESNWVPPAIHSVTGKGIPSTARSLILGAQGLMCAFGRGSQAKGYSLKNRYTLVPDSEDAGDTLLMALKTFWGVDRPGFPAKEDLDATSPSLQDLGAIAVECFSTQEGLATDEVFEPWVEAGLEFEATGPEG